MKGIKFKVYIGTLFFLLSFSLLVAVFFTLFFTLQSRVFDETVDRLYSTVVLGAKTLDTNDIRKLMDRLGESDGTREKAVAVEGSLEYKQVYRGLNHLRNTNPGLILYAYILVPHQDPDKAVFINDADVLRLRDLEDRGLDPQEEISGFGTVYDISAQATTKKALQDKIPAIEPRFVRDEIFQVNSLMGLAPIFDPVTGEFLAVLGLDISDRNFNSFLTDVFLVAIIITFVFLLLIIIISILLAGRISHPIITLNDAVMRFGERDYSQRVEMDTGIKEIWDLKTNYNAMAQRIEESQTRLIDLNRSLERFVPLEFLSFMSRSELTQVQLGDEIQKEMVILFTDIRGFASLAEKQTPKQTMAFLNEYLGQVAPIIRKNRGFVDKYLGDGLLAVFPHSADDAVRAGVEMALRLRTWNQQREKDNLPPVYTGTGIHHGTLMLGTIGEPERMQTTVIADSVNLASRLEGMTKDLGARILISREVFNHMQDPEAFLLRFAGYSSVKGKNERLSVLEVFDADDASAKTLKASTRGEFEKAVHFYGEGKPAEALKIFKKLENPLDKGVEYYCEMLKG